MGRLGYKVDQQFIGLTDLIASPVVLSILGLLSRDGLLAEAWDDWVPTESGTGELENGRNWLPFYEATKRGWTKNNAVISAIKADPLFAKLLAWDVTFLDDADFLSKSDHMLPPWLELPRQGLLPRAQIKSERTPSDDEYS
jgi:hypothetical protein